jgi:hypothetical protein
VRVLDHRVGLADAGRRSDVDAQPDLLCRLQLREHLIGCGSAFVEHGSMLAGPSTYGGRLYELFMAFRTL